VIHDKINWIALRNLAAKKKSALFLCGLAEHLSKFADGLILQLAAKPKK